MPSGITENDSMFYVRETPWHGLGVRVEGALTSEEAIHAAGLDWEVAQTYVYYNNGDLITDIAPAGGYKANVRSDTGALLGIVSDQYKVIQNAEAFSFTDSLIGEGVRYETAGSLFGGKRVWLLARLPRTSLLGEQVDPYLVFSNTHDSSNSAKVAITPVRVVCNNTLTVALDGAQRSWSTTHRGDIQSKLAAAQMTLAHAEMYMRLLKLKAEEYSQLVLLSDEVAEFIELLFPLAEDSPPRTFNNVQRLREDFRQRLQAPDLTALSNTAYGLLNAAADFANHHQPLQKRDGWQERRLASTIDGDPFIARAQLLINRYAEPGFLAEMAGLLERVQKDGVAALDAYADFSRNKDVV